MHELVTGQLPFEADGIADLLMKQITATPPRLPAEMLATDVGRALDAIIQACLAKDPAERALTAAQLAEMFRRLAGGERKAPARIRGRRRRGGGCVGGAASDRVRAFAALATAALVLIATGALRRGAAARLPATPACPAAIVPHAAQAAAARRARVAAATVSPRPSPTNRRSGARRRRRARLARRARGGVLSKARPWIRIDEPSRAHVAGLAVRRGRGRRVGVAGARRRRPPAGRHRRGHARPGRVLFERAETKFNLGRFEEALVDYQAAYEAEPLPAFLFNIGQCYRNLGNYERAQFFFRRYVQLDPRSPNRAAAEQLIAEMDRMGEGNRAAGGLPTAASVPSLAAGPTAGGGADDGHGHAFAPTVARTSDTGAAPKPLYRRPWVWIGGAVVVAAAVAAGVVLVRDERQPSLQAIDAR